MLSLISGCLLFIASSFIGIQIRRHYKDRLNYLSEFEALIDYIISEISYLKTPIGEILAKFIQDKKGEIVKVLSKYIEYLSNADWDKDVHRELMTSLLTKNENNLLITGLISIGKSNIQNELNKLLSLKQTTISIKNKAEKEAKTEGELAYKLGVLIGIALMILVV